MLLYFDLINLKYLEEIERIKSRIKKEIKKLIKNRVDNLLLN